MSKLTNSPRTQLLSFRGGQSSGDPCEAFAYHGFNGLESEVVRQTVAWQVRCLTRSSSGPPTAGFAVRALALSCNVRPHQG